MSITDELRAWAKEHLSRSSILAIADRIDAEHQKAMDEWKAKHGQMWLKGYRECHAELLEGNETLATDLESCGWIRLPVDADGVPIRVGDVMEWVPYDDTYPSVVREVVAVGEGVFFAWDKANGRYAQYEAHAYRHYKPPTVEDVLREFGNWYAHTKGGCDEDGIIAEYAMKLQLKEDV